MSFCPNCGKELAEGANFCPNCGSNINPDTQNKEQEYQYTPTPKKGNALWALLGFFLPLIGLILYLVWKNDDPENAKYVGKGALAAVIVDAALTFLVVFFVTCVSCIALSASVPLICCI